MNLPNNSKVNRFISKQTFIKKITNGKAIFASLEKITWAYKLSPKTINIPSTKKVEEIHIFDIVIKSKDIPTVALKQIKKLIPYPILFNIRYKDEYCFAISLLDESKYYFSKWNEEKNFNFVDTNLEKVYQNIVKLFLTNIEPDINPNKDFNDIIKLDEKVAILNKQVLTLKNKRDKQKQFNKKAQLNKELKKLKKQLEELKI